MSRALDEQRNFSCRHFLPHLGRCPRRSFRLLVLFDQFRQFASNTTAEIDVSGMAARAFARDVVDNVKHAEAPGAGELTADEIH